MEVRTVHERPTGSGGKFWSLNVADSGEAGFERLPDAQFRSYTISDEAGWKKFHKTVSDALKKHDAKCGFWEKTDVKKAKFWSAKAVDETKKTAVVIVEIELAPGMNLAPQFDPKTKAMTLRISGKLLTSTVRVRDPRPGNSVE